MIKVALADDHEIVRNGIKLLLEYDNDIHVLWEASDGEQAINKMAEQMPDVLIVDIRMPVLSGLEVVQKLKNTNPEFKVILLTMHNESEYILKAVQYGADGYLLKDTSKSEFIKAVKMVNEGQKYFSGDISTTIINSYAGGVESEAAKPVISRQGDYQLTRREKEILKLIYGGVNNKAIAEQLGKSIRTIETHRFNIMKKLQVNNITELLKKVENEKLHLEI